MSVEGGRVFLIFFKFPRTCKTSIKIWWKLGIFFFNIYYYILILILIILIMSNINKTLTINEIEYVVLEYPINN